MFRYKLTVLPDDRYADANGPKSQSTEELLSSVLKCQIFLSLYDADGFILRKITVPLNGGVDDQARLDNINANDATQMDAQEYRAFAGGPKFGGWNVAWTCINAGP
jgi:surface antigen